MLDLAAEVRPISRLGCQVRITAALDGLTVRVPRTHAAGLVMTSQLGPRPTAASWSRDVRRRRQLGRRGAAGRGGLRGGRRHAAALRSRRRGRPQGRLLRRPRHPRRPRAWPSGSASPTTCSTSRRASATAVIEDFADSLCRAARRRSRACAATRRIKFRDLLEIARDLGADALATGHYVAPRRRRATAPELHRAADSAKRPELLPVRHDPRRSSSSCASRWAVSTRPRPARIARALGPGGRRQARQPGHLLRAARPLQRRGGAPAAGRRPSPARSSMSTAACSAATTASRNSPSASARGLGVADGERLYVVGIEPRAAPRRGRARARRGLSARDRARRRQLAGRSRAPATAMPVEVQHRYNEPPVAGAPRAPAPTAAPWSTLASPQPGVAPGQACVCYAGSRLLGGGWIVRAPLLWQDRAPG